MEFNPQAIWSSFDLSINMSFEIQQQAEEIAKKESPTVWQIVGYLLSKLFLTSKRTSDNRRKTNTSQFWRKHLRALFLIFAFRQYSTRSKCRDDQSGWEKKDTKDWQNMKGIEDPDMEGVYLHLYGKKYTKPFRKMGHVCIVNDNRRTGIKPSCHEDAVDVLRLWVLSFEVTIVSHPSPQVCLTMLHRAAERGLKVIVAGAGGALLICQILAVYTIRLVNSEGHDRVSLPTRGEMLDIKILLTNRADSHWDFDMETATSLCGVYTSINPYKTLIIKFRKTALPTLITYDADSKHQQCSSYPCLNQYDMNRIQIMLLSSLEKHLLPNNHLSDAHGLIGIKWYTKELVCWTLMVVIDEKSCPRSWNFIMHIRMTKGDIGFDDSGSATMVGMEDEIAAYQLQSNFESGAKEEPKIATEEGIKSEFPNAYNQYSSIWRDLSCYIGHLTYLLFSSGIYAAAHNIPPVVGDSLLLLFINDLQNAVKENAFRQSYSRNGLKSWINSVSVQGIPGSILIDSLYNLMPIVNKLISLSQSDNNISDICVSVLDHYNVKRTRIHLNNLINKHIDYPGILTLIDILNVYGIESAAIRKGDYAFTDFETPLVCPIQLPDWPQPYFALVRDVSENNISYLDPVKNVYRTVKVEEFITRKRVIIFIT
ncbi:hypothetical protein FQR65_LT15436 [Abscondita terminalis]|nr:hypothetical protein FQR65_LT15436 [Abscondita terminalis]